MSHTVDQTGAVVCLLPQDLGEIVGYLTLVFPVCHVRLDVVQHLDDLDVCAAVTGSLEGVDGGSICRKGICAGRGRHTAGKGGVVSAAVVRVERQQGIQQLCLCLGVGTVVPNQRQDGFCGVFLRAERVHDKAGIVVLMPLCLVCAVHENGHLCDQIQGDGHLVLNGGILCHIGIGIEGQDASRQLIHNIIGRRLHDRVHQESRRQFTANAERTCHALQICAVRESAEQQQVSNFFKDIAVFPLCVFDQIIDIIATVDQLTGDGLALTLAHYIAVYHTDPGNPSNDARTICISQTSFHIEAFIVFGSNIGILYQVLA